MNNNKDVAGVGARKAALAILSSVLRHQRPLDAAVQETLTGARLAPRDAAFARLIATTSLRRLGQLQALIRQFVPKSPPPHKAGTTLEILVAGACELLFLNVAPHAAVDAANRLAAADVKAVHFKSLINAVLRRVSREGAELVAAQDEAVLNTPDWLWPRLVEQYGEETARAIAKAHLGLPPLDLTVKALDDPCAERLTAETLAPGQLRLQGGGRIEELAGFTEGEWWVQDFAASLPMRLFGDVAGKDFIDLCAAPGGKTMQAAAMGAHVTAVDASRERLSLVQDNLARTRLAAQLIAADARDYRPDAPAPCVLLDAPCTASGTIRRHPDLPWLKSAADIGIMSALQEELLDAAAEMTAPSGTLVYAVCSLDSEEGVQQIEHFLRRRSEFTRSRINADEIFDAAFITPEGDLRTLPSHWAEKGGMDGFYAARLVRA